MEIFVLGVYCWDGGGLGISTASLAMKSRGERLPCSTKGEAGHLPDPVVARIVTSLRSVRQRTDRREVMQVS